MQAQVKSLEGLLLRRLKLFAPRRLWLALERSKYMRIVLIRNIWMQNSPGSIAVGASRAPIVMSESRREEENGQPNPPRDAYSLNS
jgi:hypothetical protein